MDLKNEGAKNEGAKDEGIKDKEVIVHVKIGGVTHKVKCLEMNVSKLQNASIVLNSKIRETQDRVSHASFEKILAISALNVCSELIEIKGKELSNSFLHVLDEENNKIKKRLDKL